MVEIFEVAVPRDVEADLIQGLASFGITASTIVPADRGAGQVRVSRTGGMTDGYQGQRDRAEILVEVWEEDSVSAFDQAQRVYAGIKALESTGFVVPGVALHGLEIDPPRAYDDSQAPNLYRVTFTAAFTTDFTFIELTKE